MEEGRTQMVPLRLSEESYGKLRAYADAHGESVSDAVRRAIEKLVAGSSAPAPSPTAPVQSPPPPASVPPPWAEPGAVEEKQRGLEALTGREEETRRYVSDMAWRLNDVQGTVNKIMALLTPYFPSPPPWAAFSMLPEVSAELGSTEER